MDDCTSRLKPTTCANKEFLFHAHVLPYLGGLKVSAITPSDIRKWQNSLLSLKDDHAEPKYSQTYLKTINNQVSAMFNFGVRYYGLKSNPCQQAGSMGKKAASTMQFWTVEEFSRFIEAINDKPTAVVMFSLLFWTGMRSGELLALTASDFDFSVPSVSITKNYARHKKQDLILEPKTPKSRRVILIHKALAKMVQQYIASLYAISPNDRIFETSSKHILLREMNRGCKLSGVKRIRVHDLRHPYVKPTTKNKFSIKTEIPSYQSI